MAEYIEREAAISIFDRKSAGDALGDFLEDLHHEVTIPAIKSIPAADVAPVVHSSWEIKKIKVSHFDGYYWYYYLKCPVCGHEEEVGCLHVNTIEEFEAEIGKFPYCHCGAKMDGGDDHAAD